MQSFIAFLSSSLPTGILTVLVVSAFFSLWFTVDQQEAAIVTRFGKVVRVATAGLNFKVPFLEAVAGTQSLRVLQYLMEVVTKTKDDVFVTVTVSVQYRVADGQVVNAVYGLDDHQAQMDAYASDAVRAKVPALTLTEAYERKGDIADAVQAALTDAMAKYGWDIVAALVTEIDPDEKVVEAMNEKILTLRNAEAEAEAMRLEGQGIANQRKAILDGLAATIKELQAEMPGFSVQEIMNAIMLTRYFDTLQEMAKSGGVNTIMLPSSPGALGDLREQVIASMAAGKTLPAAAPAPSES